MDGFGSGRTPYDTDRRSEITNGNGSGTVGGREIYATRFGSPEPTTRRRNAASKPWKFDDAEMKRKKRIASYKAYSVEGKVKATWKKGIRWIKNKCSQIVHGY